MLFLHTKRDYEHLQADAGATEANDSVQVPRLDSSVLSATASKGPRPPSNNSCFFVRVLLDSQPHITRVAA